MKIKVFASIFLAPLILTGCGVADLARNAADVTACKAIESTVKTIADGYQTGVVDSGLITTIDSLVREQARSLLSTGLADDLKLLTDTLEQTQSVEGSKDQVKKLTDSISQRCSEAGVGS
jgi:hypothetical protein